MLITEEHFEYMTLGRLYGPQHSVFWQRLHEQRQLFTETGFAVIEQALELSSNAGGSPLSPLPMTCSAKPKGYSHVLASCVIQDLTGWR